MTARVAGTVRVTCAAALCIFTYSVLTQSSPAVVRTVKNTTQLLNGQERDGLNLFLQGKKLGLGLIHSV